MNKILNLVFDNWNEFNEPLPNLNHLNKKLNANALWLPDIILILGYHDFKINKCKLNEVNTDQNYYYVITHRRSFEDLWINHNENVWEISDEIEDLVRYKNLKIIFLSEHESFRNLKQTFYDLNKLILAKKLNASNFFIINNNSLLNDAKELNTYGVNTYKINFLLDSFGRGINIKLTSDNFINEKKFIFLCHNRRPKAHRLSILSHIKSLNLLDNDITDWSLTYGLQDGLCGGDVLHHVSDENRNSKKLYDSYIDICTKPKLSYFETDKDWFSSEDTYDAWNHLETQTYQNSYINIVTESHFDIADIHITEKSFKPFYFGQIPIFLASHNHVLQMKSEYNLDFFDDLINHDYDKEQDDTKRLNMVVSEIERLSKIKEEIKKYYISNKQKLITNHNFIENYYNHNFIPKYFKNLSNTLITL